MSWIHYMREVLGVKFVPKSLLVQENFEEISLQPADLYFIDQNGEHYKKIQSESEKVIFIHFKSESESLFEAQALQLFEKMMAAMGLAKSDYKVFEIIKSVESERFLFQQMLEVSGPRFVLLKDLPDRQGLLKASTHKYLQTYSPCAVLKNTTLKKPVWDDLQIIMKDLSDEKPV